MAFLKAFPNSKEIYLSIFSRYLSSYLAFGNHSDLVDTCLSPARLKKTPPYDFLYIGEHDISVEELKRKISETRFGSVVIAESTANLRDKLHQVGCDKFECYMETEELVYFLNQPSD